MRRASDPGGFDASRELGLERDKPTPRTSGVRTRHAVAHPAPLRCGEFEYLAVTASTSRSDCQSHLCFRVALIPGLFVSIVVVEAVAACDVALVARAASRRYGGSVHSAQSRRGGAGRRCGFRRRRQSMGEPPRWTHRRSLAQRLRARTVRTRMWVPAPTSRHCGPDLAPPRCGPPRRVSQ